MGFTYLVLHPCEKHRDLKKLHSNSSASHHAHPRDGHDIFFTFHCGK